MTNISTRVSALAVLLASQTGSVSGQSPSQLRGAGVQRSLQPPVLQYPFLQLVSSKEDGSSVNVRVHQTLVNDKSKCGSTDPQDLAALTFAVYQKPSEAGPICEVHQKKDACWSTVIEVACDGATNQATVDLYTRDTTHLRPFNTVDNPKVSHRYGTCIGQMDTIGFTEKYTAYFNCNIPLNEDTVDFPIIGADCESSETCVPGEWCSEKLGAPGRQCKSFVDAGKPCGSNNFLPPGLEDRCGSQAACVDYSSCTGLQGPLGRCVAFEGVCGSDADCEATSYCDASAGQCMLRRTLGDCCDATAAPCESGSECLAGFGPDGPISTCQKALPPIPVADADCQSSENCVTGQWCAQKNGATGSACKDFASAGKPCGSNNFTPPGLEDRCGEEAACVDYSSCTGITGPLGRCVAFEGKCNSDADCGTASYCNASAGKCMLKREKGDCCDEAAAPCGSSLKCTEGFGPDGPIFTCEEPPVYVPTPGGECVTSENCIPSEWCSEKLGAPGRACKSFVAAGKPCGSNNFLPPGLEDRCGEEATCVNYSSCTGVNGPLGRCVAFEGECGSDADCGVASYCDASSNQCMLRRTKNDCCDATLAPCGSGLLCTEGFGSDGPFSTCEEPPIQITGPPCSSDNDCPRSQWCGDAEVGAGFGLPSASDAAAPPGLGVKTCKDYIPIGDTCRWPGALPPGPELRCNGDQGVVCVGYTGCFEDGLSPLARCVKMDGLCAEDRECEDSDYCEESGFCMKRFQLGDCCDTERSPCDKSLECVASFTPFGPSTSTCKDPFAPQPPTVTPPTPPGSPDEPCVSDDQCISDQFCADVFWGEGGPPTSGNPETPPGIPGDDTPFFPEGPILLASPGVPGLPDGAPPGLDKRCSDYAKVGQDCRAPGVLPRGQEVRCQQIEGALPVVCVEYDACLRAGTSIDPLTRCVAYEGVCNSNSDCDARSYCNGAAGMCMAKFQEGDCCDALTAPCAAPFECVERFTPFGPLSTCL